MQLAGGIIGGAIMGQGQKKAAQIGADTQMAMFQQGQEATRPYREAGQVGLEGMQGLMTPEGQAQFMQSYGQTPMFQDMLSQGSENMLKQASATGGMRTGQANVGLQKIAPALMMQGMQDAFMRNQSLAGMGAGAAGQTAQQAQSVGAGVGGLQAQAAANQANIYGQMAGEVGGYLQNQLPSFGRPGSTI
jgi:hypothetical protein